MEPIRLRFQYEPGETRESLDAVGKRLRRKIAVPAERDRPWKLDLARPGSGGRPRMSMRFFILLGGMAALLGFVLAKSRALAPAVSRTAAQPHHTFPAWMWVLVITLSVALMLLRPLVWYLNRRFAESAHAAVHDLIFNVTADEAGLIWDDSRTISTAPWKALSYAESPALFTLFQDDPTGARTTRLYAIPKRAFAAPTELQRFRDLLALKAGEAL